MDINEILGIILPIVFILVGIALVVFVIELIKTVKYARTTIDDIKTQIDPTLKNVQQITTDIQPVISKVDPLVERVQLTVDSVNLEMMRVDQILEDVSQITDTASSATTAVDKIAGAPLAAVSGVASKIRNVFGDKSASDESAQLAEQRVAVGQALQEYQEAEDRSASKKTKKGQDEAPASAEAPADEAPKGYQRSQEFSELEQVYEKDAQSVTDSEPAQKPASKPLYSTITPSTQESSDAQEKASQALDGQIQS